MDALHATLDEIRRKAAELREQFGDEPRARALEWAVQQVESALRSSANAQPTLREAALQSGYSADHLARLIRKGKLPNAGRRGSPRIRAGDLPTRLHPSDIARRSPRPYDPRTDARALRLEGRLGGSANGTSQAAVH